MTETAALTFIAAEPREFDGFLQHLSNLRSIALPVHWARRGTWKSHPIILAANGAGPGRSAMAAEASAEATTGATAIISVGFCGALDPELKIGDIVVADKVFFINQMLECQGITTSLGFRGGAVFSSAQIAATATEKQRLRRSGAIAVEMEAAGLAQVARQRGYPFYCIRTVTDLAGECFSNDFDAALGPDGRYRIVRLIGSALLKPHKRVTELIRLKKRCELAAERLGQFLDSCRF